ncbi:MAG: hypothetical protein QW051_05140 [Candidatus Aenigmatarchaeota archaeon]
MEISTRSINQSLNLYSIFGYLLPGFFFTSLIIIDYDLAKIFRHYGQEKILTLESLKSMDLKVNYILDFFSTGTMSDFKFIPFIIFLFFCYLIGHIISAFSSFILERLLVKGTMGFPSKILVAGVQPKYKLLFGNYRRPLKSQMIGELKTLINKTFGYNVHKDDYYWLCYSYIITTRPFLAPRVHHFVNLYGFSRNITAAVLLYISVRLFLLNFILGSKMDFYSCLTWCMFLIAGAFMFWNYLKLFKRQAIDIYYLFLSIKNTENGTEKTTDDD